MKLTVFRFAKLVIFHFLIGTANLGVARPADRSVDLNDSNLVDQSGCYKSRTLSSPFLVSDVYRAADVEKFSKQNGSKINIRVDSDHLISQYVKTAKNSNARLPRGSLVALNFSKETIDSKNNKSSDDDYGIGSIFNKLFDRAEKAFNLPTEHQSFGESKIPNEFLDVQVLTSNDIYSRMQDSATGEASVENGETAYKVPVSSLIAVNNQARLVAQSDFSFTLAQLPNLNQSETEIQVKEDSYFQIVTTEDNHFETYTCYQQNNPSDSKAISINAKSYYLVEFFDSSRNFEVSRFYINPFEVNFSGNVLPLLDNQVKGLTEVQAKLKRIFKNQPKLSEILTSFSEINYQGYLRLPTEDNNEEDEQSLDNLNSYVHYGSEKDPLASDDWGQPSTICGIIELSYLWKQFCDKKYGGTGCTLQIGDIAFPVEGNVASQGGKIRWKKIKRGSKKSHAQKAPVARPSNPTTGKDLLGHHTHSEGTCVDIRPLRKDNQFIPTNIKTQGYDLNKTIDFVKMAKSYGTVKRFFNDRRLVHADLTEIVPGHDDHVHICFEEKNFCDASSDRIINFKK